MYLAAAGIGTIGIVDDALGNSDSGTTWRIQFLDMIDILGLSN